jgi:hypothetical protein
MAKLDYTFYALCIIYYCKLFYATFYSCIHTCLHKFISIIGIVFLCFDYAKHGINTVAAGKMFFSFSCRQQVLIFSREIVQLFN